MPLSASAHRSFDQSSPRPFAQGAAPIYLFVVVAWALMPLGLTTAGLELALGEFAAAACLFTLALWTAWCLRARGVVRIAAALEACTLFYVICITLCLLTFVAGTGDSAYFDGPLARADLFLLGGFDWPGAMRSFSGSGLPVQVANQVYGSIVWQPPFLIAALSLLSAHDRIWHFLVSWIATLSIVTVIFALYPVAGAYHYFGMAASDVPGMLDPTPWNQPVLLEGLRSGTLGPISLGTLDGIINYPSFHAGAAVLLAHAFWQIRVMRWPFAALNALMLASAVPIGGHYVVDLVAGVVTAIAGIAVAGWVMKRASLPFPSRVLPSVPALARQGG